MTKSLPIIFVSAFLFFSLVQSEEKLKSQNVTINHPAINPKDFIPKDVDVDTVIYANLQDSTFKDIIVRGVREDTDKGLRYLYAGIISYNLKDKKWENVYQQTRVLPSDLQILIGRKTMANKDIVVLVFKTPKGSVDYTVLGYIDNEIKILLRRSNISECNVEIKGEQIIEEERDKSVAFNWTGFTMIGIPSNETRIGPYTPTEIRIEENKNSRTSDPNHLLVNPKDYIPEDVKIDSVKYANMTSLSFKDIIVEGTFPYPEDDYRDGYYAAIISFDPKDKKWKNIYVKTNYLWGTYNYVDIDKFLPYGKDVVIFASNSGNGWFLDYTMIGYLEDGIKILLERGSFEGGSVGVQGDYIIEGERDQTRVFWWTGDTIVGASLVMDPVMPYSPKDKIVEYTIDEKENVFFSEREIKLPIGQKLILIRTNSGVVGKLYTYSDGILADVTGGWVGQKIGTTHITIRAEGYSFPQKAEELKVHVIDTMEVKQEE